MWAPERGSNPHAEIFCCCFKSSDGTEHPLDWAVPSELAFKAECSPAAPGWGQHSLLPGKERFLRLSAVYYFWVLLEEDNRLSNLWVGSSCPWIRRTTLPHPGRLLAAGRREEPPTYLRQVASRLQHGAGDWEREKLRKCVGNILQAGFNTFAALQSSCPLLFVLIAQQIPISSSFCLYSKSHLFLMTVKEIETEVQLCEHVCVVQVMLLLLWALIQESPT